MTTFIGGLFGGEVLLKCGHKGRVSFKIDYYYPFKKEPQKERVFLNPFTLQECPICYEKNNIIRCSECGSSILPGHLIRVKHLSVIRNSILESTEKSIILCSHNACMRSNYAGINGKLLKGKKVLLIT